MKFDKELAIALLKLIDAFPTELFLRPTVEIAPSQWQQLIPEHFDKIPAEKVLWHLYILSHSDLICPSLELEEIRTELEVIRNSQTARQLDSGGVVFGILKSVLRKCTLTVQGYEYLSR